LPQLAPFALLVPFMVLVVLALTLVALHRLGFGPKRGLLALGGGAALASVGVSLAPRQPPVPEPIVLATEAGYASSRACRSCHPAQYSTFHDSFHRSMTELASDASIRAPWQGALVWRGRRYEPFRRGDEYWMRLPDPDRSAALVREGRPLDGVEDVERRVVMTTGSHHYQAYWVEGSRGNELWQAPFVYHFESGRFIARHDAFLQPEDDPPHFARWNSSCIQCHSVAGQPRHDLASDRFESRAVELGVACEACHGAGAEHIRREQNPLLRHARHTDESTPTVVNPARLDAERGSEVCGQCHSYFVPRAPERWWESGFAQTYAPGNDLDDSRRVLDYGPDVAEHDPELSEGLSSLFYPDGTIRVGGREWNGLKESACYLEGRGDRQLACTSCHRLHGGSQDDQLGPDRDGNGMCLACHSSLETGHSRHAAGSSGDRCVNCHMPRTTYALFKAIRSHRITIPRVDRDPSAPLNACNACHQNRSLDWTERASDAWAARQPRERRAAAPPRGNESDPWSALAVAALSGDAAARVIAAAALGDPDARAASGSAWQPQLLAEALDDPYAAIRFVAQRSLRSFAGFEDLRFDFDAPLDVRLQAQAEARRRARTAAARGPLPDPAPLPLDPSGALSAEVIAELRGQRDTRPIRIAE
jgi:predicted CXXCH cytochrome family protein